MQGEPLGEEKDQTAREPLEPLILVMRGQRLILDADLARLYGVTTKRFNESFKRNQKRFPADFAFQLSTTEFNILRSYAKSQIIDKKAYFSNWSQFAASSALAAAGGSHRGAVYRPWAFTEHGALMAANLLRSEAAVRMSVFVVRAFVRLREQAAANAAILKRLAEIDQTLLQHDSALRDVYRKLQPLLAPAPESAKRRIGF
jgi:hypothetical protein